MHPKQAETGVAGVPDPQPGKQVEHSGCSKVPAAGHAEKAFRKSRVEEAKSEVESGEFDMHG